MAIDKQQLHVQPFSRLSESSKPLMVSGHLKAADASSSPELDAEQQPGTPMRVSCSGPGSATLKPQYSEDDSTSEDLSAAVQPLERVATAPPSLSKVQQHQQEQHEDAQWTAATHATAVLATCLAWVFISSATILINKHIMVDLS